MIDKKHLLRELESEFEKIKKELGFKATFEELEEEFAIKDAVCGAGFIGNNFSRQLCSRIVDHFRDWTGYLNGLLMSNPGFFANQTEAKLFQSEADKKMIWDLMKVAMKFSSLHSVVGLSKNKELEARYIDESLVAWKERFNPGLTKILERVHEGWKKE